MNCTCGQPLERYRWVFQVAGCYDPAIWLVPATPATATERYAVAYPYEDQVYAASFAAVERHLEPGGVKPVHDIKNSDGTIRSAGVHTPVLPPTYGDR